MNSHRTTRQDNINLHMCHMRMSLKAQTHFNTNRNIRLRHCPPISVLTTPYAFRPPPLPSLCSQGALPTPLILTIAECPPDTTYPYTHGVPSRHAPDTTYPYACKVPPDMLPTPLTLCSRSASQHAPDTTYPYACVVPSRHAPDTTYACVVPSRHAPDTTYACAVPSRHHLSLRLRSASQHAPDTTYPYASVLHP
ncbi:hypothetical protein O181_117576 [Austropuccinia psidii MF-1]|uniref:Uncharacterized protein n=1 Tax=Austropuccinia psidii MF-1 TaxID=1389203 RepID=A0A9Q3KC57_9BASI|nr:hypothetical protein [Austropuccinia psidii MF-1]